jgi:SAM-dependent methyltransferase
MLGPKRSWLVLIAALGAVLYRNRASLKQLYANVRAFGLPSVSMYDALIASLLVGFYARVADEVAATWPSGTVLDVGSGTGHLAVRLAQTAPGLAVVGVDLSPAMVERAARHAARAGLSERVRFEVGDAGSLPLPESSFDVVVSTGSLHHWPDPARGLGEIHRVLKPGGEAWIYDLAHWLWPRALRESRLSELSAESPFGSGTIEAMRWPGRVPAFVCLRLR